MKNLVVLPTLDGSKEAAVARLEALDRRHAIEAIESELDDAYDQTREITELVGPASRRVAVAHLSAVADSIANAEHEIDKLVAS